MKSAVDARQRPTAALLEEPDPYSNWTSHDYRIQEAINTMDKEVCKSCGNPVWLCHSSDNRIEFQVKTGTCYGKGAIDELEKKADTQELGFGEYRYSVPIGASYENEQGDTQFDELPTRREAILKVG